MTAACSSANPGNPFGNMAAFAKREIDALDQEPLVLVMAVDEYQTLDTMPHELADRIPHLADESRRVEAGGAAEMLAAAAFGLGFIAIGQRRSDNAARCSGGSSGNRGCKQGIRTERQVRTVLLERAHRQENGRLRDRHPFPVLLPAHAVHVYFGH
jgi:hypothetical protein